MVTAAQNIWLIFRCTILKNNSIMILKNRAKAFDDFLKLKCENFSLSRFSSNESINVKDVLLKGILRFFQKKGLDVCFLKQLLKWF